jgi:hypothetical protein
VADGRRFNRENIAATLVRCRPGAEPFPVRRERQMPGGSVITVCGNVIVGGSFGSGGK